MLELKRDEEKVEKILKPSLVLEEGCIGKEGTPLNMKGTMRASAKRERQDHPLFTSYHHNELRRPVDKFYGSYELMRITQEHDVYALINS